MVAEPFEVFVDEDLDVDFADRSAVARWCASLEPGSAAWESALRLGMYVRAATAEDSLADRLFQWLRPLLPDPPTDALDLGCGVGGLALALSSFAETVTAVDASPVSLRAAGALSTARSTFVPALDDALRLTPSPTPSPATGSGGVRWVCGSAFDPPFAPAAFDLTTAVNLFDSVRDPAMAIGQAIALLAPGGWLLVSQPDAWSAGATDPSQWLPWSATAALVAEECEVVAADDQMEWELQRSSGVSFRYRNRTLLARRR